MTFEMTEGLLSNLANDKYHSLTDWYSSTQLKKMLPETYKDTPGNQEALDFGTLVHSVVLEPDNLDHYVPLDADKIGVKADGSPASAPTMTAAWKRAVTEVEQDGKTVTARSDWDRAHRIRDAITKHPVANQLLYSTDGASEESAFATINGIRMKARFDRRAPGYIADLKTTTAKPGADSLTRAVLDWGYETSAVHYLAVAEQLGLDVDTFVWIFASKEEPHRITVCEPDQTLLDRGRALRDLALKRITDPSEPPYEGASGFLTLTCPRYARLD